MEALCVLEATPSTATTAAATATAAEPSSLAPPPSLLLRQETSGAKDGPPAPPPTKLWRVPCGKKDIFQSTALSAGEKRQLMKVRRAPGHPRPTNTTQHYADHHYCCQRHPTAPPHLTTGTGTACSCYVFASIGATPRCGVRTSRRSTTTRTSSRRDARLTDLRTRVPRVRCVGARARGRVWTPAASTLTPCECRHHRALTAAAAAAAVDISVVTTNTITTNTITTTTTTTTTPPPPPHRASTWRRTSKRAAHSAIFWPRGSCLPG